MRLDGAPQEGNLRGQLLRHRRAIRLVLRVLGAPDGVVGNVERDADEIGRLVGEDLAQHLDEAVDGVGRQPLRVGQLADRVEGAEEGVKAVDQQQLGAARHGPRA